MKLKFGKKSIDIFNIKQNFFTNNDELLKKQKQILRIYKNQPKRKICKICKRKLQGEFFINHQMKYVLCNYCSHINGYEGKGEGKPRCSNTPQDPGGVGGFLSHIWISLDLDVCKGARTI